MKSLFRIQIFSPGDFITVAAQFCLYWLLKCLLLILYLDLLWPTILSGNLLYKLRHFSLSLYQNYLSSIFFEQDTVLGSVNNIKTEFLPAFRSSHHRERQIYSSDPNINSYHMCWACINTNFIPMLYWYIVSSETEIQNCVDAMGGRSKSGLGITSKDLFRACYLKLTMKDWLDFDRWELNGKWTFLVPRTVCACSHR